MKSTRHATMPSLVFGFLSVCLGGCSPSTAERQFQQQAATATQYVANCRTTFPVNEKNRKNAVPYVQCLQRAMSIDPRSDDIQKTMLLRWIVFAEQFSAGKMTYAEYLAATATSQQEASVLRQSLRTQQQIAKNTKCISERQRVSGNDYGGVNSTSGAVAIISLLGAVADAKAVSDACD